MTRDALSRLIAGLGLGTVAGWIVTQQLWVAWKLLNADARRTLAVNNSRASAGVTWSAEQATPSYEVVHTIEGGIERIVYRPARRRFETPILMQHGMWHGAWCWHLWQTLFAEWGWESHAVSLPGHGASPEQRPVRLCTLDYYLSFLRDEVERLPRLPILMGHSMGGALAQWYFKHVGNLPAAVLVAPWVSHSSFSDGFFRFLRLDPIGFVTTSLRWQADFVRSPARAARALISPMAVYSPEELYARLGPESALVMYQHNPPFWYPPERVSTATLWLAGEKDAVLGVDAVRRSARHYRGDFALVENAGHNLMMEHNYQETAERIHRWLVERAMR